MATKVSFVNFEYLQKNSPIYANLSASDVDYIIPVSQDVHIERILGTALYNKLKTDIIAGTISGNYKTLLDDYINPGLVFYIALDAIDFNAIKFTNKGLLRKASDNSTPASQEELQMYKNKIESFAEYYGNRTVKYLCANTNLFPEYNNPGSSEDTIVPTRSGYKATIFIPGKGSIKRTYDKPDTRID
jgi:hypothetical protein